MFFLTDILVEYIYIYYRYKYRTSGLMHVAYSCSIDLLEPITSTSVEENPACFHTIDAQRWQATVDAADLPEPRSRPGCWAYPDMSEASLGDRAEDE